jgi:2-amino-4-hydroxy-6-hydroxymethyldihydropteridine diphosphokinase
MEEPAIVYIGIGSNLDQPERHVCRAIDELGALPGMRVQAVSSLYRSAPLGPSDQADFINAAAGIETYLSPLPLLDALKAIEARHGRRPDGARWGPRPLDLDILLYADRTIVNERLTVPHRGLPTRAFVLYPLTEIDPKLEVPGAGPVAELLQHCPQWRIERLERNCDG